MLKTYLPFFTDAGKRVRRQPWFSADWFSVPGYWPDEHAPQAVLLKISKHGWTNDTPESLAADRRSESGIHFAAWVDAKDAERPRLRFGMHVFELPRGSGPRLKSSDFTNAFRTHCRAEIESWPGAVWGRGPRTPFAGEIPLSVKTLTADILEQMDRFGRTESFVDAQLARMRSR